MPITISEISPESVAQLKLTPKFFSSALTGRGAKQGAINEYVKPGIYPKGLSSSTMGRIAFQRNMKSSSQGVTNRTIVVSPIARFMYDELIGHLTVPVPVAHDEFTIRLTDDNDAGAIWFQVNIQGIALHEDKSHGTSTRDLHIAYRSTIFTTDDKSVTSVTLRDDDFVSRHNDENWARHTYSYAPISDFNDLMLLKAMERAGIPSARYDEMKRQIVEFYDQEFSVYANLCHWASVWSGFEIGQMIADVISCASQIKGTHKASIEDAIASQLHYLENYPVPLASYGHIYNTILSSFDDEMCSNMVKQNTNILMNATLDNLSADKATLETAPEAMATYQVPDFLSNQQQTAIRSIEPLIITQAGAGTGKSTVVSHRLAALQSCGVPSEEIMVLSFTNAAANNIKERNPGIHSMTIASLIDTLYRCYFQNHVLSSPETIENSILIEFPGDTFAHTLASHIRKVSSNTRNNAGAHSELNSLIERNRERVIEILDHIRQTSLEIEIIMAYQMIDDLGLPPGFNVKHLIIDEVQDNSIFEFIYLLKMVHKLKASLFIVGKKHCSR